MRMSLSAEMGRMRRAVLTGIAVFGLAASLSSCSSGGSSSSSSASSQALLNQGIAASKAGNYKQAMNLFGEVIKKEPKNSKNLAALAFYNLGVIHQKIGPASTTVIDYKNAVRLDPAFLSAWYNLAIAETKNNPQAALAAYNKILALKANDTYSLFNSGLIMYAQGDTAGGAARINQAIKQDASLAARVPANVKL